MRVLLSLLALVLTVESASAGKTYPVRPVPFTRIKFADTLWAPRIQTSRTVTIPHCFDKCRQTGRLDNFKKAAGRMQGSYEGAGFNDSDVFKIMEGAAYALAHGPDPKLDRFMDELIASLAAAQEADGYLYALNTVRKVPKAKHWQDLRGAHELYNAGHLYEAAVAHFEATGKRTLLHVAIKNADLLVKTFGPDKLRGVPGHEEIEMALVRLSRATGNESYLELAKFFVAERGNAAGHKLYGEYAQDHKLVRNQNEPSGHAVRACYLYSGVTDISALTGNKEYARAMRRVWDNIVRSRIYVTGGIGSVAGHEGFGHPYVLPNRCYAETCGAVASGMWNHRMFLQHGHAKYIDVLERTIYNAFLSGISISGNRFFYRNPIASSGAERPDWYQCACCPANVARFVPSIGRYFYAVMGNAIYINLYAASTATIELGGSTVTLEQSTDYPWDGHVDIAVKPGKPRAFNLLVRVPGWARNEVVPHHLYTYADKPEASWTLAVNGEQQAARPLNGYVIIKRTWKDGDVVTLDLPMPVRRVKADKRVKANKDMVAIERGPIVYCLEAIDNGGLITDIALDKTVEFTAEHQKDLLGGITVIKGKAPRLRKSAKGLLSAKTATVTAIPFYAWAHRGRTPMSVWMPATSTAAHPLSPPSIASRSRVTASYIHASIAAVNDQVEPKHADDRNVTWFDWWPQRNSPQWLQYDFGSKVRITKSSVHWFDDTPVGGGCGLPQSWRLLYRKDGKWVPVEGGSGYAVDQSRHSTVTFSPVTTDGLRLEAQLTKGVSAGVMEWAVE